MVAEGALRGVVADGARCVFLFSSAVRVAQCLVWLCGLAVGRAVCAVGPRCVEGAWRRLLVLCAAVLRAVLFLCFSMAQGCAGSGPAGGG